MASTVPVARMRLSTDTGAPEHAGTVGRMFHRRSVVQPLPGIWDDARLNTAITLPIGPVRNLLLKLDKSRVSVGGYR